MDSRLGKKTVAIRYHAGLKGYLPEEISRAKKEFLTRINQNTMRNGLLECKTSNVTFLRSGLDSFVGYAATADGPVVGDDDVRPYIPREHARPLTWAALVGFGKGESHSKDRMRRSK